MQHQGTPKDDIMQEITDLRSNYTSRRVTSANKFFRDDMPNSAHHDIMGDGEDKIFSAVDQACEFMGLENQCNDYCFFKYATSSVVKACSNVMWLQDFEDLPDDISGIFSDDEEEEEQDDDYSKVFDDY
jgi:hypothetical protein